jgi:hypothetical protein
MLLKISPAHDFELLHASISDRCIELSPVHQFGEKQIAASFANGLW